MPLLRWRCKTGGVSGRMINGYRRRLWPYMMLGCLFVLCAPSSYNRSFQHGNGGADGAGIALAAAKSMGVSPYPSRDGGGDGGIRRL